MFFSKVIYLSIETGLLFVVTFLSEGILFVLRKVESNFYITGVFGQGWSKRTFLVWSINGRAKETRLRT